MDSVLLPIPRALLAALANTAAHSRERVDPIDAIRRGEPVTTWRVTYQCAPNCPPCQAQRALTRSEPS